jgi:hypothetical protein
MKKNEKKKCVAKPIFFTALFLARPCALHLKDDL